MTYRPAGGTLGINPEVHSVYYMEGTSGYATLYSGTTSTPMSTDPTAPTGQPTRPMRADALRSHAALLKAATAAFAEHGANAPLEDIARNAGVGIGTLYRHFPSRVDLQAAVFKSQVEVVCSKATELSEVPADQAFASWIRTLAAYLLTKRGLSSAVINSLGRDSELLTTCWKAMHETATRLLTRAQQEGAVRMDVDADDVMRLVHGVAVSTERVPEQADRLLSIMLDGLRPAPDKTAN